MRQLRTGKSVDRRPVSFVFVSVQDEPKLPPDEKGWTLALSEDLFSEWEERKKSRAERCRCACHPLQTHILHTFSFILVSA